MDEEEKIYISERIQVLMKEVDELKQTANDARDRANQALGAVRELRVLLGRSSGILTAPKVVRRVEHDDSADPTGSPPSSESK